MDSTNPREGGGRRQEEREPFKAPEGRAVARRGGSRARSTASTSSESSVRRAGEPGSSISTPGTPQVGRKRKAESEDPALIEGEAAPPSTLEGVGYEPPQRSSREEQLSRAVCNAEQRIARLTDEVKRLRKENHRLQVEVVLAKGEANRARERAASRAGRRARSGRRVLSPPSKGASDEPAQQARKKRREEVARSVSRPRPPPPSKEEFPPLSQSEREWKQVTRKRRKAGGQQKGDAPPAAKPANLPAKKAAPPPTAAAQKKRRRARAAPQTAAVTITATGEQSYAEIMKKAREGVSLQQVGVKGMTLKRARNGGFLLEIPGADGPDKADCLARALEDVLCGDAVVARPVKSAELRITGLDDSVTPQELERAICAKGECARSSLRMGNIRRAASGLGAVWVRCPLAAALRLEKAGRIEVGWSTAVVRLLEARPLQCYRCLLWGHTASACKGQSDRSGRCFNCGGADHVARDCTARSRCPVCDVAGEPADHRMGGPACVTLKRVTGKKGPPVRKKGGTTEGREGGGARPRSGAGVRPPAVLVTRPAALPASVPAPEASEGRRRDTPPPGPREGAPDWKDCTSPEYGDVTPSQDHGGDGAVVVIDDDPSQVSPDLQLEDWEASP